MQHVIQVIDLFFKTQKLAVVNKFLIVQMLQILRALYFSIYVPNVKLITNLCLMKTLRHLTILFVKPMTQMISVLFMIQYNRFVSNVKKDILKI